MTSIYYIEVNMICLIFLGILLSNVWKVEGDVRMKYYRVLLLINMVFCFSDMVAGVARGKFFMGDRFVIWTANIVYFVSTFVLAVIWVIYSMYMLYGRIHKKILIGMIAVTSAAILLFMSAPLNGWCFTINDKNLYSRGPMLWTQWVVLFPSLGLPSLLAVFSKAGKRERRAVGVFAIMPFMSTLLQIFVYGITVSQFGTTCSLFLVYILFQSQKVNEAETRAKILNEMTNTDELTGLKNRRAYELRLEEMRGESWIGVLFADLNGLKRANDTEGHAAGDRLIRCFADIIRSNYVEEEIYRISGDEFVVLSTNRENFDLSCRRVIAEAGDMASEGISEGAGFDILTVISRAEKNMYQDKYDYYSRTGMERRRG